MLWHLKGDDILMWVFMDVSTSSALWGLFFSVLLLPFLDMSGECFCDDDMKAIDNESNAYP